MQFKRTWKQVDGVLLLDKPGGVTSNEALQKVRRLLSAAKGGHTGTLDPMATGLLPLCFGEATKFSADLLEADKTYEARVCLGSRTDTGDREGRVLDTAAVTCSEADIRAVLPRFIGRILQVPPMYSALKRDGLALHELARQGLAVEREPRPVTIYALELLSWQRPFLDLRVTCSKGTYIRVLAEDLGQALGCGAHLAGLRRTRVGPLDLADAVALTDLEHLNEAECLARLKPVDALLASLPAVFLSGADVARFRHGNPVPAPARLQGLARVYDAARLLGVGEARSDGRLWPRRLTVLAPR
ncbi:MAG: tRNA pseudouridine(55) synthase TruB [Azovibrio sp.]|nr:tRNA pseudouridine(55) synthase TruB [Azovibrio sp.]